MNAIVTGAGGMLGHALVPALERAGWNVRALPESALDVTDFTAVRDAVAGPAPDWVFNLAAFTRVDECETQADRAHLVNGLGARNVALACAAAGAALVQVSTDYVFDGRALVPYREYDPPAPMSVYGASKLAGERAVREVLARHVIARTSWLYGAGGPNFVDTILAKAEAGERLRVVDDQCGAPTYTEDLAAGLVALATAGQFGTYHVTNGGFCTWYEFAKFLVTEAGLETSIEPTDSLAYVRPARRPANSMLSNQLFDHVTGRPLPAWQDAARRYLRVRGAVPRAAKGAS
jgi:dTDP-4-dehydrorhamnose reductase